MRRWVLLGVLLGGCAGRSDGGATGEGGAGGSEPIAGTSAAGAGASPDDGGGLLGQGGNSGPGLGTAGSAPMPAAELPEPVGDGVFPLFWNDGREPARIAPEQDGTIHLVIEGASGPAHITTHSHHDFSTSYRTISFEVRASRRTTLLVATTGLTAASYAADKSAGYAWRGTEVAVTTTYETHNLAFRDMQALGPGELRPATEAAGTALHFVLPDPGGVELWFRNIELRP